MTPTHLLCAALLAALARSSGAQETTVKDAPVPEELLTVAERSGWKATALHADVVALLDRLAARSPLLRRGSMGTTFEGREIPLLILADPPVATAEEARDSGKTVVFAFGDIHAGEVEGKEALPMLAREIALAPEAHRHVLDELVLVLAPIYNADGNERVATDNRPEQLGPEEGQGQRPNAQGLDLNRDYMKLESPEARAMARLLTEWDPHLVIDTHTTDGSFHRYLLTYAEPLNPAGPAGPIALVRDELLPEVTRRLLLRTGWDTFFYGNFEPDHGTWSTYDSRPRFGAQYHGLRGHLSILTEAYSHAPYKERVLCTLEFVREVLLHASENAEHLRDVVRVARQETAAGLPATLGVRHAVAAAAEPVTIRGWVEEPDPAPPPGSEQTTRPTAEPKDYVCRWLDHFEPTVSVTRPYGYLIPPESAAALAPVIENLRLHGIEVYDWSPRQELELEVDRVDAIEHEAEPFQNHNQVTLETTRRPETRFVGEGWTFVPVRQPLGTVAVYLLEPQSDDGLVNWNVLDGVLAVGADYPILRLPRAP